MELSKIETAPAAIVAVVLAAGRGTRMKSERVKVLHQVLGRAMVAWPVEAASEAGASRVAVVIGPDGQAVREALEAELPGRRLEFCVQAAPLGTGDAVRSAKAAIGEAHTVLILCGDTPALDAETLRGLLAAHSASDAALTVLSFRLADPTGYGRIVRDEAGGVLRIVEHRDASDAERGIDEVNAGIYVVRRDVLLGTIDQIGSDNAQGEIYLTDVVELAAAGGHAVQAHLLGEPWRVSGINTRVQLAELEEAMLVERRRRLMESGATLQTPESIRIEGPVEVGRDTVLGPGVQLLGRTRIGDNVRIDAGCVLRDVVVEDGAHLLPYVVAEDAHIGRGATAGPFTHLRTGTVLGVGAKAGNFVELKKSVIGEGSKVNHLSYLGDCAVGHRVNIGAGTITCNYDGTNKHRTIIEDEVFIGSDTQLVAPVRLGRRSTVAAGTTVTRDVPEGALVLSRVAQTVHQHYDERHRRPREAEARDKARPDKA